MKAIGASRNAGEFVRNKDVGMALSASAFVEITSGQKILNAGNRSAETGQAHFYFNHCPLQYVGRRWQRYIDLNQRLACEREFMNIMSSKQ